MRVVMLDAPAHFLEERRRLGHDHRDEMWEGVLHLAPQPTSRHQELAHELGAVLLPLAKAQGLVGMQEPSVYRPGEPLGWRIPELGYARRQHVSERGVEGRAELVVEIRSPGDETYDKLPFYGEVGVRELLVVDRDTCAVELFVNQGGRLLVAEADANGGFELASVSASVSAIPGRGVRMLWKGGSADAVVD